MPLGRKYRAGVGGVFPGPALMTIVLLTGCMGREMPSMLRTSHDASPSTVAGGALAPQAGVQSALIADLQGRRSVLVAGGAYAKVADAVLAASSGAAAAELRPIMSTPNAPAPRPLFPARPPVDCRNLKPSWACACRVASRIGRNSG